MNILITINSFYKEQLKIMLKSLNSSNIEGNIKVYCIYSDLSSEDIYDIEKDQFLKELDFSWIKISNESLKEAPVSDRYPKEMYYRLFAYKYLPKDIDKILYLDPDIIVLRSLKELYSLQLEDNFYAAASHIRKPLRKMNEIRLGAKNLHNYVNSGVMLINLKALREENPEKEIYSFIEEKKNLLFLPDQDVINGLFSDKIVELDPLIYNLSDRILYIKGLANEEGINWVKENTKIIHYCGRNKPWKDNYVGKLGEFYYKYK
ncbi:MAG: glycosyltransferase family 8 protein [Clostridiales bacterium]|nr:glycosyltransferase family 8 protein [Clostridiales bacterium]